jgi:hypothetical protein
VTVPARVRRYTVGAGVAGCLAALPVTAGHPLATATVAYALVLVLGRSRLPWARRLSWRPVVRISVRLAAFFVPMLVAGVPRLAWSWWGAGAAVGVAAVGLYAERDNLRTSLRPRILRLMPYERPVDRAADVLFYLGAGAAQEYLHRGLWFVALVPLIGPWTIPVSAVLFVAEHLAQPSRLNRWDHHDLVWQAFLSVALGTLVYLTGALPVAILGHTLYNLPNALQSILRPVEPPPRPAGARYARTEPA